MFFSVFIIRAVIQCFFYHQFNQIIFLMILFIFTYYISAMPNQWNILVFDITIKSYSHY